MRQCKESNETLRNVGKNKTDRQPKNTREKLRKTLNEKQDEPRKPKKIYENLGKSRTEAVTLHSKSST